MEQRTDLRWPDVPGPWKKISPSFWLAFWTACAVGAVTHLYMFTNLLPNHDSIRAFCFPNDMLEIGRWASSPMSAFSTFFQLPMVIGLLSILALGACAGLTVRIIGLTHPVHIVLASALLVTYPATSAIFSYLFTADAYFLALLLNVLGVWCTKNFRWGWAAAIPMLALACGTYQAFICYAIGLFLIDCVLMLLNGEDIPRVVRRGLTYIGVCLAGLILYYIILRAVLLVTGTQLTEYQGLNGISLANLLEYLGRIPQAYLIFFKHFLAPDYLDRFHRLVLLAACLYLTAAAVWLAVLKGLFRDLPRLLLTAAGLLLLPLALNFIALLATDGYVHHVMIYAFALIFLLAVKFTELIMEALILSQKPGWTRVFWPNLILCGLLVWCGFCANNISYLRMQLRYENSYAAANRIAARVEALGGYSGETPVAFVGHFPDNLYGRTVPEFSNPAPITGTEDILLEYYYSAQEIFRYCIGLHLPSLTGEQWRSVYYSDFIYDMPCWPAEGSVIMHEGVAVVKLGEI